MRRVLLDDLAQARDLHVDRAVEHLVLAAAGELHQLVARQRLARVLHEHLEDRELAGRERDALALARKSARGEVELEGPEAMHVAARGRRPGRTGRAAAPQDGVDAGEELARIEGL